MIPSGIIYTFTPSGLSIEPNKKAFVFSIYPNPVKNVLTFKTKKALDNYHIEIFDLTGQGVKSFSQVQNNQINISDLASGVYFLKIIGRNQQIGVQKFIKQ